MVDFDKPLQTREHGWPVRIICRDKKGPYPVLGLALQADGGDEIAMYFKSDGGSSWHPSYDLVNIKVKKEGWVNVYPNMRVTAFASEAKANSAAVSNRRIACVRIEWEE